MMLKECIWRGMVAVLVGFSMFLWATPSYADDCPPNYTITTVTDPPADLGGFQGNAKYCEYFSTDPDCPHDHGMFTDELTYFQSNIVVKAPLGASVHQSVVGAYDRPNDPHHYDFWWGTPEHYGQYVWKDFEFKVNAAEYIFSGSEIKVDDQFLGGWYDNTFTEHGKNARFMLPAIAETYMDDNNPYDFIMQTCDITIPGTSSKGFPMGGWTLEHLQYDLTVTSKWDRIHANNKLTVTHEPSDKSYHYRYRIAPHPFPEAGAWEDEQSESGPKVIDHVDDGFQVAVEVLQGTDADDPTEDGYVFQNGYVFDYWRPQEGDLVTDPCYTGFVPQVTFPPAPDESKSVTAVWKHDIALDIHIVRVGVYTPYLGTVTISSESVDDSPVTTSEDITDLRLTHGYEFTLEAVPPEGYVFFAAGYAEENLDTDDLFNAAFLPGGNLSGDVIWLTDNPITSSFSVPEPAGPGAYYSGGVITVFFIDEYLAQRIREEKTANADKLQNCYNITSWLGDPVYPYSGEFCQDAEDLRVKSPGMDFVWARKYCSRTGYDNAQGFKWDYNYNISVELLGTEHILYHDGNGRIDIFAPSEINNMWRAGGRTDQLEYNINNPTAAPVLHMSDGMTQYFNPFPSNPDVPGGKIQRIEDRNGNQILFEYDSNWHLTEVTDTLDRSYTVTHNTEFPNRITSVYENYVGGSRSVSYYYNTAGDLVEVTGPGVGENTTYSYDDNHNLVTITDARGNSYLTNTYVGGSLTGYRVTRQQWGNASDSITFQYESTAGLSPKTTVTDRNGNVMDMFFGGSFLIKKSEGNAATEYSYNKIGMPASIRYPNGNQTLYAYEEPDFMNPAQVTRGALNGNGGIGQQFEYLPGLSGCVCGTSFVTKHVDGRGKVTNNEYDTQGNLTAVHYPGDAGVDQYTYNAQGQVRTHTWPGGRIDSFAYTNGYMTGITQDVNGIAATVSLGRDPRGNVTSMVDAEQNVYGFEYDAHDRVTRIESPGAGGSSNVVTIAYDLNGNATNVHFENSGTGEWQNAAYAYDILNYRTQATLSGARNASDDPVSFVTGYAYDGNRNVTSITSGEGGTPITFTYNERNLVTGVQRGETTVISYEYDLNGNIAAVIYGGGRHEYTYDRQDQMVAAQDPLGNLTTLAYDANGNLTSVQRRDGQGGSLFAASYTYDDVNRLIEQAVGDATTKLAYNQASELAKVTNPNDHAVSFGHDTLSRLTSVSNDVGDTVSYEYDKNGNVLTATQTGSGGTSYTTTFDYDALNRLISVVDSADPTHPTSYVYDARSNLTSVTRPDGKTSTFAYDGLNRLVQAIHDVGGLNVALSQTWDSRSRLQSRTDGSGNTTQYDYDGLDRLGTVTYADSSTRNYAYDDYSNLTGITAPNGASASFAYDTLSRMVSRTFTKGASSETAAFAYDGLSRLVTASAPGARVTREYDSQGNLTAESLNGETVRAAYDLAGNMVSQTYPHGRTLSFAYDGAERLTQIAENGGALVSYAFDGPNRLATKRLGNGVETAYAYDNAQNVTEITAAKDGAILDHWGFAWDSVRNKTGRNDLRDGGVAATYQYDGLQRLIASAKGADPPVQYTLDAAGNRTAVTNGPDAGAYVLGDGEAMHQYASAPIGAMTYDENGNLLAINQGQGDAREFAYDARDQLVRHVAHHTGGWQPIAGAWTTAADSASGSGRIVKARAPGFNALSFTYTADSVSTGDPESYGFAAVRAGQNAAGCLIYVGVKIRGANIDLVLYGPSGETVLATANVTTGASVAYDFALNMDLATGAVTLRRALHGESLADIASGDASAVNLAPDLFVLGAGAAVNYAFTAVTTSAGGVVQEDLPDRPVTTRFQYDPFGRKVRKIVEDGVHPPQTTRYAYSGWRVVEEQDNTGQAEASYVYGRYVDEPVQMKRGGNTAWYLGDDLYNVTTLTNTAGEVVERYRYEDFGAPHVYGPAGDPLAASAAGNPYLFTGRAYDAGLELYDYRSRHLHPGLGRFTTRDRIGLWGDPANMGNPFTYVGNNPSGFVDPYGLERWGAQSYVADMADVGYGYFIGGPLGLVGGLVSAIAHPFQTAAGLAALGGNLFDDPSGTAGGLAGALYDQFEDSDAAGQAAFGVASTVVPLAPGAARALTPAIRTTVVVEKATAAGGTLACEAAQEAITIKPYGILSKDRMLSGQTHHLNQAAAYRDVIPYETGQSIKLEGNIFTDVGSPHYLAHVSLEEDFWSAFRFTDTVPTNLEYTRALQQSLRATGALSEAQVQQAVRVAIREQINYGLLGGMHVPKIPGPINNLPR